MWLVLVIGVSLSLGAGLGIWRTEVARDDSEFHRQVSSYLSSFELRKNGIEDVLRALRALFNQNLALDRRTFNETYQDLNIRLEGVQALGWMPKVAASQRPNLEKTVRQEGFANFQITEGDLVHVPKDQPTRAGERSEYYPVLLLEPYEGNEAALGYDLGQVPQVKAMMDEARDSGRIMVSAPVGVRFREEQVQACVVGVPVFHPDLRPDTVEERRAQLAGYAFAVVVFEQALSVAAQETRGFALDVLLLERSSTPGEEKLCFTLLSGKSRGTSKSATEADFRMRSCSEHSIPTGGREWLMVFRRGANWKKPSGWWYPIAVALGGIGLTITLSQRWETDIRMRREVEQQVAQRSEELAASSNRLLAEMAERQRIEAELYKKERQILQGQKLESLGVLAGGVAHDFNNLLTVILGNADVLLDQHSKDAPEREGLEEIKTTSLRAADLCRQMLAYAGKGRFVVENNQLPALVTEITSLLQSSISKKATLTLKLEEGVPPVRGDSTQLRQIIMNLVLNASEALGEAPGEISVHVGVRECSREYLSHSFLNEESPEGSYVSLTVADTGCGMDAATLERIFEPFFTTKFTGRGLGLSAVLGIVRSHKGALLVDSQPGKGSRFTVLFPVEDLEAEPTASSTPSVDWIGEAKVLLVEDEAPVRAICKRLLERMGLQVLTAADGVEALDQYRAHGKEIALVLLDLTMPRLNGEETFRELRKMNPRVQVVISSGFGETEISNRFEGQGLAGFIQKPYTRQELANQLRQALRPQ